MAAIGMSIIIRMGINMHRRAPATSYPDVAG
jgi:hypothetical protein